MIVFAGEYNDKCKYVLFRQHRRLIVTSFSIGIFASCILIAVAMVATKQWTLAYSYAVILPLYLLFVVLINVLGKKTIAVSIPQKTAIDTDRKIITIYYREGNTCVTKSFDKIKKVIEMGDCYYLRLGFPNYGGFVCPKDLIVEGSTAQLESAFMDRLIKL